MAIANIPFPPERDFLILEDFAPLRLCAGKFLWLAQSRRGAKEDGLNGKFG
jgi:hypothetical protein